MHHIHRTKAYVLKNLPLRENDSQLFLLTKDFGLIRAIAQGSKKMESKMRQSIQDYSLVEVALISGRNGWKLVNTAFVNSFFNSISGDSLKKTICKVLQLTNRMIVDELPDSEIFNTVNNFIEFAEENEEFLEIRKNQISFEAIFTARILNRLGYLNLDSALLYLKDDLSLHLIEKLINGEEIDLRDLAAEINRSIHDSGL